MPKSNLLLGFSTKIAGMTPAARESRLERADMRRTARRAIQLDSANVEFEGVQYTAAVREISVKGILLECKAPLTSGDIIVIHALSERPLPAKVIWSNGNSFGCEFARSVSKAAISAALLKSPYLSKQPETTDPDSLMPESDRAAAWRPRILTIGGLGLAAWATVVVAARALLS